MFCGQSPLPVGGRLGGFIGRTAIFGAATACWGQKSCANYQKEKNDNSIFHKALIISKKFDTKNLKLTIKKPENKVFLGSKRRKTL